MESERSPLQLFAAAWEAFDRVRMTLLYLFVVAYAVGCLAVGTTVARYIGGVLLALCALVAFRSIRRRFAKPS